jgi:diguanylate cyclase (GGDEF)-like protein/PAS domain S-box-containing protein
VLTGTTAATLAADVLLRTSALVVVVDERGRIVDANPATLQMTRRTAEEVVGHEAGTLLCAPKDAVEFLRILRVVGRTGKPRVHEHDLPRPDPDESSVSSRTSIAWTTAPVSDNPTLLACVGVDVSEARSAADDLLARSLTDELTGLPNRSALLQKMARMSGTGGSVLFCDLNGFKAVNDKFGHAAGDRVLVEVARRLVLAVRGEDLVARLGGDEFVILAPPHPTASPEGLSRRVLGAMRQPMLLGDGVVVVVGVSVGTAQLRPGQDPAVVLQQADAQMYSAKSLRATGAGRRADPPEPVHTS